MTPLKKGVFYKIDLLQKSIVELPSKKADLPQETRTLRLVAYLEYLVDVEQKSNAPQN